MISISYTPKSRRPPVSDYVSSEAVVPSEVTPGKTVLFYKDSYGCLFKGKVISFDERRQMYTIDEGMMKKRGSEVRYSKGHGEA